MKIERDKVYLTRSGEKVRVVCVDAPGESSVIAIHHDGVYCHEGNGCFLSDGVESRYDLVSEYVEPPKPREAWVYVAEHGNIYGAAYTCPQPDPYDPAHYRRLVKFREVIE